MAAGDTAGNGCRPAVLTADQAGSSIVIAAGGQDTLATTPVPPAGGTPVGSCKVIPLRARRACASAAAAARRVPSPSGACRPALFTETSTVSPLRPST